MVKMSDKIRRRLRHLLIFCLCFLTGLPAQDGLFAQHTVSSPTASKPAKPNAAVTPKVATTTNAARAVVPQVDSSGAVTGSPWSGSEGIQETTAQIMARQRRLGDKAESHPKPWANKIPPDRKNLRQNPDSPAVSQYPAATQQQAEVEPHAPQTLGTSFTAATLADTGAFPPDTMGAVGPTQYLLGVNGRLRVFDKNTGVMGVLNVSTDTFFASVRNGAGTSDPRVRFDRLSGRWFVVMINVALPNRVLLAVSDNATITGGTVWTFFFFQQEQVAPPGDASCLADYPTLGIDANALYIGVNQFCGPTFGTLSFGGTTAFVIRKSSVLGAGPIVVTAFRNLTGTPSGAGLYTPQGVDNYDPAATEGYFVGVDNATFGTLVVRRVLTPGATPSLSANTFITTAQTSFPITVRHQGNTQGTNGQLDGLDDRLFAAHIRNGRLWTAHNISVDNAGLQVGARTRNASRWYEIQGVNTATPTIVQSGTLFTATATNTFDERNYWIPSVMVSGQGHMALGASMAGTNEFANGMTAGRLATDALGTLQAPVALTSSTTAYNPPGDTGASRGSRRWGDYSYTSLDPCDDMTMWTVQQFSDATNSYGVRVVKLLAPPPPTLTLANPPSLPSNSPSVNVMITGTSASGSGFYDPGTGFSCRLGASISGGVTVNSVTYQNPTTIVLNVSTVGASAGAKNVTITNPDGQSVVANSFINISAGGGTDTIGLYSPTQGAFFLRNANSSGVADISFSYGPAGLGWLSLVGDWNGDGVDTIGLYSPTQGAFFLRNANSSGVADVSFSYGPAGLGWVPLVGDWDGDGTDTVGLYSPTQGAFFLRNANSSGVADVSFSYGPAGLGWIPVVGDWDGNGTDTIGLYSPTQGAFFLRNANSSGVADVSFSYGPAGLGWVSLVGDWNGDGTDTIGIYSPTQGAFFLRNANSSGVADVSFSYGPAGLGWVPIIGDWNG